MKPFFYLLSSLAIIITFASGIEKVTMGRILFTMSPYFFILYLLKISKHQTATVTSKVVAVFIVSVGLYFLLDTTYMERKLGDKFSFLFIPIWQWTMLLVSGFVIYLSNDKRNKDVS